jgi:hypothetical protein
MKWLNTFNTYCNIEPKDIILQPEDNMLKHHLTENLSSFLIWNLSKISHKLIQLSSPLTIPEDLLEHESLITSKLITGGIEDRLIHCFDQKVKDNIHG